MRKLLLILIALVCTVAPSVPIASAQATATSLTIAIPGSEGLLTPYTYVTGYPGYNLLMLVYDSIEQLDADNIPRPLLARQVTVNADGSRYDIDLRPDIRWHDGQPLTADDVKFTVDYFQQNTQSRFTAALRQVQSVSVNTPTSLTITLTDPNPAFVIRALADVPVIPRHIWSNVGSDALKQTAATVGSGPYTLVQADPDTGYVLHANPAYFLGPPTVGELRFPIIKDPTTSLQALRAGEVQATTRGLTPEQIPQFSADPFGVMQGSNYASTLLELNDSQPPLDRVEVRQAIDLAIDKQQLVDTVLLGAGTVGAPGFIHPDSQFHDPSVQPRYDPEAARQLLDSIGASPGADGVRTLDGAPLAFTLLVYANNPVWTRSAELIADMLGDIGIQVTVSALDPDTVDNMVWPGFDAGNGRNYSMSMWGWSAPVQVDASRLIDLVHSDYSIGRNNISAYQSPQATALADKLRTTANEETRKSLVQTLERTIAQEVPFVDLYFQNGAYPYRADVYSAWVYQKGQGPYTKLSFITGLGH
jgi:peptide/nickel transport system substrate-binding protein